MVAHARIEKALERELSAAALSAHPGAESGDDAPDHDEQVSLEYVRAVCQLADYVLATQLAPRLM